MRRSRELALSMQTRTKWAMGLPSGFGFEGTGKQAGDGVVDLGLAGEDRGYRVADRRLDAQLAGEIPHRRRREGALGHRQLAGQRRLDALALAERDAEAHVA